MWMRRNYPKWNGREEACGCTSDLVRQYTRFIKKEGPGDEGN